ncbi:hypothetical protein Tco_0038870 [Tanacetum coccineum]
MDQKPSHQESCGRLAARNRELSNKAQPSNVPRLDATDYLLKRYTIVPSKEPLSNRDMKSIKKAWKTRNGMTGLTRGGAKTSSQRSRKDYRSGGSFEVWKALLEEE